MLNNFQAFEKKLLERKKSGLYRSRVELTERTISSFTLQNKSCVSYMNNDYLGLATHPKVIKALQNNAACYGVGSSASQLLGGHYQAHRELEEELAAFMGQERALVFSSGYLANLAVFTALFTQEDCVLQDRLNHASLIDGARFSPAKLKRYRHLDLADLERLLSQTSLQSWICSDGVFSMDGDITPLPQLIDLAKQYQAGLIIDDAHGIGVLGKNGRGVIEHFQLNANAITALVLPFGKAFGTMGAAVVGSNLVIETILQFARSYIYTTALPPALAAATQASLQLIQAEAWRRSYLQEIIPYFAAQSANMDLPFLPSVTPIQSLIIGSAEKTMAMADQLKQRGILVSAVRPPSVAVNTSRLRINLTVNHSKKDIDRLLESLASIWHEIHAKV